MQKYRGSEDKRGRKKKNKIEKKERAIYRHRQKRKESDLKHNFIQRH